MKRHLLRQPSCSATVGVTAQNYSPSPDLEALHVPFDALLDENVRDGLVYYRALQANRGRLSRYIASLNSPRSCPATRSGVTTRRRPSG